MCFELFTVSSGGLSSWNRMNTRSIDCLRQKQIHHFMAWTFISICAIPLQCSRGEGRICTLNLYGDMLYPFTVGH